MSIRKRKWTNAEGETVERWIADYFDQSGKRHQPAFKRKKEAEAFLSQTKVDVRAGVHSPDSKSITVSKAADLWIERLENSKRERTTLESYRQHVDLHIVPYLGSTKLSQLTVPLIRSFQDALQRGDKPFERPRSPAMIKRVVRSLGAIVSDAQEAGHVSRNVVRDFRGSRNRVADRNAEARQKGKLRVGVDIPTPDEIRKFISVLGGRWRPLFIVAIFSGLRSSELRGLQWQDVDFSKQQIHVRRRADRYKKMGKPKTVAGERSIPVPPIVKETLTDWKKVCPAGELVFPTGVGTIELHQNIINRGLKPMMIAAGVIVDEAGKPAAKYTGLHALRHFFASWLFNRKEEGGLGLSAKIVQERMGHSSINVTLNTYAHLFPQADQADELAAAEAALMQYAT